jgi:hypothetical protein
MIALCEVRGAGRFCMELSFGIAAFLGGAASLVPSCANAGRARGAAIFTTTSTEQATAHMAFTIPPPEAVFLHRIGTNDLFPCK